MQRTWLRGVVGSHFLALVAPNPFQPELPKSSIAEKPLIAPLVVDGVSKTDKPKQRHTKRPIIITQGKVCPPSVPIVQQGTPTMACALQLAFLRRRCRGRASGPSNPMSLVALSRREARSASWLQQLNGIEAKALLTDRVPARPTTSSNQSRTI